MKTELQQFSYLIGGSLFFAVLQISIGAIELPDKSYMLKISTQEEVDNAIDSFKKYLFIASIWTLSSVLILYGEHGITGAILGLLTNLIIISWIYLSYMSAINSAIIKYNLKQVSLF